ncbi:uncharacterized protein MONOS_3124 [Monocercomonoides exilis]|uniref:uncharacterized protein n=1 Tax=Monocercomonoides exilis TaxID=2049356 RepID=UPI00355AB038|nr:hypothetical protein MONOS_3124 [Monocercomonoides exilis]|eukprot:MONOS_3124.1-p1 / transcript=MONOS_3124.1 / gene=MONOS_3124 / organism=Monocercomonoides_exilis_PA203 / gene_product=unspecified product / transcript_product=unspecified product / location=Mono_scaffold00070:136778-138007(-) / protein_length=410 / sequence_SO=supercontig / SO=protein_coding / is_pseudo=false
MFDCNFSSVCDVFDGGIVPSLNNPLASLTVSNISFLECRITRNANIIGTAEMPLKPGRQNIANNGSNAFTWCEWNGSSTIGTDISLSDGISSGGAICVCHQTKGELSVFHCLFNNCFAYSRGGGIMFHDVKSVHIEYNTFNSCTALNHIGGAMNVFGIRSCTRISGCEFKRCKAKSFGGEINLDDFQVSATNCIESEKGGGESACVFDCSFTSCFVENANGGGMRCYNIPVQVKIRSIQFISCNASSNGGGLSADPRMTTAPKDGYYFYFLFFHKCECKTVSNPYGHDMVYGDHFNLYLNSGNPFYVCYTTNTDETRVCYAHEYLIANDKWLYQHTEKKDWLKKGVLNRLVAAEGGVEDELCGIDESSARKTIGIAASWSTTHTLLVVTLMEGNHRNEEVTIETNMNKM